MGGSHSLFVVWNDSLLLRLRCSGRWGQRCAACYLALPASLWPVTALPNFPLTALWLLLLSAQLPALAAGADNLESQHLIFESLGGGARGFFINNPNYPVKQQLV